MTLNTFPQQPNWGTGNQPTVQIKYRMSNKYIPPNPLEVAAAARLPSVKALPVQRQHLHWTNSMMQCTASRLQRIISQGILKTKPHKEQHASSLFLSLSLSLPPLSLSPLSLSLSPPHSPPPYNYKLLSTDSVNVILRPRRVKVIAIFLPIAASLLPSHHKNVLMSLQFRQTWKN